MFEVVPFSQVQDASVRDWRRGAGSRSVEKEKRSLTKNGQIDQEWSNSGSPGSPHFRERAWGGVLTVPGGHRGRGPSFPATGNGGNRERGGTPEARAVAGSPGLTIPGGHRERVPGNGGGYRERGGGGGTPEARGASFPATGSGGGNGGGYRDRGGTPEARAVVGSPLMRALSGPGQMPNLTSSPSPVFPLSGSKATDAGGQVAQIPKP